ncbi:MAG: DUF1697 domain-containing protein [Kofleriaceae bacterium]
MHTWIVLLRGINVGGHGVLPMKRLVELMEKAGCLNVRTYIQSGNAVCTSKIATASTLAQKIGKAILAAQGFEPKVMVLSLADFAAAAKANPYPTKVPTALHLFFLAAPPADPSLAALEPFKLASEKYTLDGRTLYFYTPDGFGTSKLASKVENLAKVDTTARNWNTVEALLALAAAPTTPVAKNVTKKTTAK